MHSDDIPEGPLDIEHQPGPDLHHQALRKPPPPKTTSSLLGSTSIYSDDILRIRRQHSHPLRRHPRQTTTPRNKPGPDLPYQALRPPTKTTSSLSWATPLSTPTTSSLTGNTSIHFDDILRIRRQHSHPLRRHPRQTTTSRNKPGPDLPHQALRKPPPPKTTLSPLGCTSIHSDNILRIRRQHSHAFRRHSRRPVRHRKPTRTKQSEREYRIFSSELPLPLPLAGPQRPCRFLPDANKRAVP